MTPRRRLVAATAVFLVLLALLFAGVFVVVHRAVVIEILSSKYTP